MWASDHSRNRSQNISTDFGGYEISTTRFDDYVVEKDVTDVDLIVIDDVSFETRVLRGAIDFLTKRKPELIVNCYRHGAYAIGAPTNELLQTLHTLGYRMRYAPCFGSTADLQEIEDLQVPELDHFVLHAIA
jgi:hypothetical protein